MEALVSALGQALLTLLLRLILVMSLAWLLLRTASLTARHLQKRIQRPEMDEGRRARLQTLLSVGLHSIQVVILVIAALTIVQIFGVTITPVLTGVGVVGLAVSLGAQALIRDFIGGLLILLEDQFRVGDVIQVGATSGKVEQIRLRTTQLRDEQGRLWIIPNGEVRIVSNQTRGWARAVVDLDVPAALDPTAVMTALTAAMARVAEDPHVHDALLEAPQVQGWNSLTDQAMQVRLTARTAPGKQWSVARVMRKHAAEALRGAQTGPADTGPATSGSPADG